MTAFATQLRCPSDLAAALNGKDPPPRAPPLRRSTASLEPRRRSTTPAIVYSESAQDVAAAVLFADERGLRIAPQATGHNAPPLGSLEDTIMFRTERMRGIRIDPERRTARVEAGVLSQEVSQAAARHGLAGLQGSSRAVAVAGHALGGGLSFLGRKHGLAANSVRSIELVTADGRLV